MSSEHAGVARSDLLHAQALAADPKVINAKKMLLEAVKEQQAKITDVRQPNPSLKQNYDNVLSQFANYRGAKLYFPFIGSGFGNGALVELLDGSIKYDFICGIGPHFFGHSYPAIIEAAIDAALGDTIMQGHLQQNVESVELSGLLLKASGMQHCFLSTSGVIANENALKLAFQKKFPANRVLAFERCFIGRTLAMSQITDKPAFREGLPLTLAVDYIPFFDPEHPQESTKQAAAALKKYIARYPKQHAVMIFELVQGEGGFYYGTHEFFTELMDILKEHNIAIFADEVQTFARTPQLFAYQYFGLEKYIDLVSIGKVSQVCATLFTEQFKPKPGLLSQTFTGSTSAIHCAKVVIENLMNGGFYGPKGKIQQIHDHFEKQLKALAEKYPTLINGPFGIGCMIAFTPYQGDSQRVTKLVQALFEAGILSFVAGSNPMRVRFLPPAGAIKPEDIDKAMKILEDTLLKG